MIQVHQTLRLSWMSTKTLVMAFFKMRGQVSAHLLLVPCHSFKSLCVPGYNSTLFAYGQVHLGMVGHHGEITFLLADWFWQVVFYDRR